VTNVENCGNFERLKCTEKLIKIEEQEGKGKLKRVRIWLDSWDECKYEKIFGFSSNI
jgi:hypothetical protein